MDFVIVTNMNTCMVYGAQRIHWCFHGHPEELVDVQNVRQYIPLHANRKHVVDASAILEVPMSQ